MKMPQFIAISRGRHANACWPRSRGAGHARHEATVPLLMVELSKAILSLPVAFITTGARSQLVALLSIVPGRNMFVAPDGRWLIGYEPAAIRAYPFRLLSPEQGVEPVLCIDESCDLLPAGSPEGVPFFNSEGGISSELSAILEFLVECERNRALTDLAVATLSQANLIVPWLIKIRTDKGEQTVDGLYKIDEAALNALPTESFEKLRATGALPIAYGQLFSMNQLSVFKTLADLRAKMAPKPAAALPDTLDKLFDTSNNDYLRFD